MKTVYQIVLAVIIVILGYLLYESIMAPIRFEKEKNRRYKATIERLKNIRTAQDAYRSRYGKYTGSFDTLIDFMKHGEIKVVKQIGSEDDSLAVALKKVYRDTILIPVRDTILKGYPYDSLRFVPFTGDTFELAAGELNTQSGIKVKVFECKAPNKVILKGLDRQEIINLDDLAKKIDKYPGLKVGSLTEATNNAGNWE
jgi:type II secretory pathway pseudopilin PulG